ncbi:hypothetical protein ADICYQ_3402 [Cyclobacterium qasimii M12-11B]|uniref:Uncharacterized protein n=1 Tax=Cyclobacterium qasimii M12-11B TaxID=641524 RepID=S7WLK1_9BACT|nr:hypothetical protein ADICYQ_3402 [Cyclobacterium qasimii M12-11B]
MPNIRSLASIEEKSLDWQISHVVIELIIRYSKIKLKN